MGLEVITRARLLVREYVGVWVKGCVRVWVRECVVWVRGC